MNRIEGEQAWLVSLASISRRTSASLLRCNTSTASVRKFAEDICEKVGIPAERRVNQLTDAEVPIRETIDRDYVVEGDLRRNSR